MLFPLVPLLILFIWIYHAVIEAHTTSFDDLRLTDPFPELLQYARSINLTVSFILTYQLTDHDDDFYISSKIKERTIGKKENLFRLVRHIQFTSL